MTFREAFRNAYWIASNSPEICPIIRQSFHLDETEKGEINIVGFSSFKLYINGKRVGNDYFLPLASDYEPRNSPSGEKLSHRTYVSRYDITEYLKIGKNTVSVILGNGWYTGHTGKYREIPYGDKKLCFSIKLADSGTYIGSDESAVWQNSFVKANDLNYGEEHDYRDFDDSFLITDCDDSGWNKVVLAKSPDTEYYTTDCPCDRVVASITPRKIRKIGNAFLYDVGENITGFPVLRSNNGSDKITLAFSEDLSPDGELSPRNIHGQYMVYNTDGKELTLEPCFTWFGFRYFTVEGDAEVETVHRIHADIELSSDFECDNETLNWLYRTYLNTQLCNMHQGIPSDCPHIERRGYTGDGQLTCRAAMLMLSAKAFYRKWISDISDCQDRLTGHIQYTAPYTHSGGGPGGWGSAIVKVPYEFWKIYGDDSEIKRLFPQMLSYFDYMDAHSEYGLVTSDKEGEWCLGEWCLPPNNRGKTVLPPSFVNTYFYIKAMSLALKIAEHIKNSDFNLILSNRIEKAKCAMRAAYFNNNNGDFFNCQEGANAFALDIGLGDERTRDNFIKHYESEPYYDTGIFGTDIVTRLLFEYGRADIAVKLMSADSPRGFGKWKELGATTLWEYWENPRSKSHPMFGAVCAHLFDYVLGIRCDADGEGYRKVIISPATNTGLGYAKGHICTAQGNLSVEYRSSGGERHLTVEIPSNTEVRISLPCGDKLIKKPGRFDFSC